MSKTLPTLIRISKFELDEKQRALADLLRTRDAIIKEQKELEEKKQQEEKAVKEKPEMIGFYDGFLKKYMLKKENLAKALEDIDIIIEQAREILREAYQQHKTYEITHENIQKKEKQEQEQKEQKNADEMALNFFRKK